MSYSRYDAKNSPHAHFELYIEKIQKVCEPTFTAFFVESLLYDSSAFSPVKNVKYFLQEFLNKKMGIYLKFLEKDCSSSLLEVCICSCVRNSKRFFPTLSGNDIGKENFIQRSTRQVQEFVALHC